MDSTPDVRVALYIRVSTAEQASNFSFETQKRDLLRYVDFMEHRGWHTRPEWMFLEQASGGSTDRKELNRLMKAIKNREVDVLLIWKIDRLSRKLIDIVNIFATLSKYDVGFCSYSENMDFTSFIGKMGLYLFAMIAEFERDQIMDRTQKGKRTSALAGNYVGGSVPYGYKKKRNASGKGSKLEVIPKEARVVQQIFHWFLHEKSSLAEIARRLNKLGIKKGTSQQAAYRQVQWRAARVRLILTNDTYRGKYISNRYKLISKRPWRKIERDKKDWIISHVEPIVSETLFFDVQYQLEKGRGGKPGGGQRSYMFSRKIIDVDTGKGFIGYTSSKGTRNYMRKKFFKDGVRQPSISIASKGLETFVWNTIEMVLKRPDAFIQMYKNRTKNNKDTRSLENEYQIYKEALSNTKQRISRVKKDYYDGYIDAKERSELLDEYSKELSCTRSKIKRIEKTLKGIRHHQHACNDVKRFSRLVKGRLENLTYEQKSNIIRIVVKKVEVHHINNYRLARVFFRFQPDEVVGIIPRVGTNLPDTKENISLLSNETSLGGGQESEGHQTFALDFTIAHRRAKDGKYISHKQYSQTSKGCAS